MSVSTPASAHPDASAPRRILEILRAAGAEVSGQAICEQLGISRTAVWKHIGELRQIGYDITAHPRRGYLLQQTPNRPLALEVAPLLRTKFLGRRLHFVDAIDSTNRRLTAMAEDGAPEGSVLVADSQTGGRGRMGRTWFSPAGANLYVSMLLRPPVPPQQAPSLSLAVGVAAARALRALLPRLPVRIKWPNDLMLNGKKLGGILCEMRSEPDRVHYVVVGIGLNVNVAAEQFPPGLHDGAVSLKMATGRDVSRPQLLAELLAQTEAVYRPWIREGLAPFLKELETESFLKGRQLTVELPSGTVSGKAVGVTAAGALILETAAGRREILSGDVHIRKSV